MTKTASFLALGAGLAAIASAPTTVVAQTGFAIDSAQNIISFSLASPGTALTTAALSGLRMADGLTADPSGTLYDLAFSGSGTLYGLDGNANLYSVNASTGAATFIASTFTPAGFDAGLAYDPFTGQLRWVSDAGENISLSLGGVVAMGSPTFYAAEDASASASPVLTALAIDSEFGTGYAIDSDLDTLAMTLDPNFQEFFTVGSLGLDVTGLAGADFINGSVYAALSTDAVTSSLYLVDTATGAASLVGSFGTGVLAFAAVPEPSTCAAVLGALTLVAAALRRRARALRA